MVAAGEPSVQPVAVQRRIGSAAPGSPIPNPMPVLPTQLGVPEKLSIVVLSKYILAGASVNASVLWNEKSRESYFPLFLIRVAMTALWSPKSSLTCSTSTGIQSNRKLSLQKM